MFSFRRAVIKIVIWRLFQTRNRRCYYRTRHYWGSGSDSERKNTTAVFHTLQLTNTDDRKPFLKKKPILDRISLLVLSFIYCFYSRTSFFAVFCNDFESNRYVSYYLFVLVFKCFMLRWFSQCILNDILIVIMVSNLQSTRNRVWRSRKTIFRLYYRRATMILDFRI